MPTKLHTFELTWSPEGKIIGTVQALTPSAAKRKAPKPYVKFLGEISATCLDPSSFYVVIQAKLGNTLIGGVNRHVSSRFESRDMALAFGEQQVEASGGIAGRVHTWEVVPSSFAPEVFAPKES